MDSKFISDEIHFHNLYNLISHKYRQRSPDVIIVSDDNALRFIREYGDEMFPGTPVVFTGINDYESILEDLPPNYTGIIEKLPVEENIDLIMGLHPSIDSIYLVTDDTYSGLAIRKQAEDLSKQYESRMEIRYPPPDLSSDEMIRDLENLPKNSIILFATYNTISDKGISYYNEHYIAALSNQDMFPVYAVMNPYNDYGITGGCQISTYDLGRQAAVSAKEILEGADPADIPVDTTPEFITAINYGHIPEFGLDNNGIPDDTVFFNRPSSMVTIPKGFLIAAIFLLLFLGSVLVIALIYNRSLKAAENELKETIEDKNFLLRENHHRVKNNLAIIGSLVAMQAINSDDKDTKQKLKDIGNRIYSMSIVHDNIYQSENISRINMHDVLLALGEKLIQDYSMGIAIDFEVKGEDCLISPEKAVPLSLAVNEIISNSLKFAFEENGSGKIMINYDCKDEVFRMTVSDDGKGIDKSVIEKQTESIGFDLIENLVSLQLNGTAEVNGDSGTTWTIQFPIKDE